MTDKEQINSLDKEILLWIYENPGHDSIDVAKQFDIPVGKAHLIVSNFLKRGDLDFDTSLLKSNQ